MSLRKELRQHCRTARAAFDAKARDHASLAIAAHLAASQHYRNAHHVAIYWPIDDEVDLRELLRLPSAAAHSFYLPRMLPDRVLEFRALGDPARLRRNDRGIAEPLPEIGATIPTRELDLVCVPLLGFDRNGNRLGQGGGFYDRAFAFVREERLARPLLIGVAFACQELATLERATWDVPLHAVVTEHGLIECASGIQRRNAR